MNHRFDLNGACNGILAGLISITSEPECVDSWAALVIGFIGGITYCLACRMWGYFKLDDPVEAICIHFPCGFISPICAAFFHN
jgi:Amt family ammonium transporter